MMGLAPKRLSKREKRTIIAGMILASALVITFSWVLPAFQKMENLDIAIEKERRKLQEVQKLASVLMELNEKERAAHENISRRATQDFSLASVVEGMAREAGIMDQIQALKPSRSRLSESYEEISVALKATQLDPSKLVDFLYTIESSKHLLRVRSIQIRQNKKAAKGLDVTMTIFTLLPTETRS